MTKATLKEQKESEETAKTENPLVFFVGSALAVERPRIAAKIRQTHLKRQRRQDPDTDELLKRIQGVEDFIDGVVADVIRRHPAYPWFSRVKGIGGENIAKVIGLVDISKANRISSLWKYAGYAVDNGHAPKAKKGEKTSFNKQLRTMCWRLGVSLMKAKGKFYEYYLQEKEKDIARYTARGCEVVPTDKLPKDARGKCIEPEGAISEWHIHHRALRKMIKLFLACLWLEWRKAENLPISKPYAIDRLNHVSFISPEEMVDR